MSEKSREVMRNIDVDGGDDGVTTYCYELPLSNSAMFEEESISTPIPYSVC